MTETSSSPTLQSLAADQLGPYYDDGDMGLFPTQTVVVAQPLSEVPYHEG